jgi:Tol biopolymer transport system component
LRIARVIEVTDGSTIYMQPVWSPDGNKLAFTRSGFTGLYVRNADGSGPITEITSADYSGYKPVWTSDSKGLVMRTRTGVVGQRISYIDVATGEVRLLEEGAGHPTQPEMNVYGDVAVDVDGQAKVLNESTESLENKDGYYSEEKPASRDLRLERDENNPGMWVVIEGDGTQRMQLPHRGLLASLSPTRERVAFLQGDGNLYVSYRDGAGKVSLGRGSGDWDWSPDGESIVYVGDEEDNGLTTTASELFVADCETGAVTQLTSTPGIVEMFPRWSPEGMRIAYSTHRAGKICVALLERANSVTNALIR